MRKQATVIRLLASLVLLPLLSIHPVQAESASTENLGLTLGKSVVLDFPADIRQISTSDPVIVDAVAVSTREILLHAKSVGVATVVVWSKTGDRVIYGVTVE